jgi:type I restriction enzyme, S subunit
MSEWEKKTLGEVVNLKRGYDLPQSQRLNGDIPIYSSSGISGFHDKYKALNPGVITGRYGTIGNIYFANAPYWPLNTTLYVEDFKGNNEVFIYYFLKQINWSGFSDKSAVPGVNRNDVHKENILLPSLPIQKKIADILSCLDRKIENLRKQNETLEEIARSIFKHWFIDFEFPNADGKPYKSSGGVMVRSELGDIPEGWYVGKLGDEFEIIMGQSPAGSSFNEEKQGMVFFQGRTDFDFRFPTVRLYTTEPKRIAEKFDVLVSVRAPVGDINVACERCCIGRGLAAIRSEYKSYCLHKLKSFKKFFDLFESEGTVFGSINKQSFNDLTSIIPTNEAIKKFEILIISIDKKFYLNNLQIQTLTKTRDTLLPKLMSGQLRVEE